MSNQDPSVEEVDWPGNRVRSFVPIEPLHRKRCAGEDSLANARERPRHAGPICFALVCALLLAGGCGKKKEKKKQSPPKAVSVLTLRPQNVRIYRNYVGRTHAFLSVDVRPQTTGLITGFFFKEGQHVRKGQLLFTLDPRLGRVGVDVAKARSSQALAEVRQAEAQLGRARDAVRRYAPLSDTEAIPRQQYADALAEEKLRLAEVQAYQARAEVARAEAKQAEIQLGFTSIRAPIAGVIGMHRLTTGGLAAPGDTEPLATISQSDPMRVTFAISDADYLRYMAPRQRRRTAAGGGTDTIKSVSATHWKLVLADGSTYDRPGRFYALSRAANPETDTVEVVLLYANPGDRLRPEQYASVQADVERETNVLLVPVSAVRETQGTKTVWVVSPGETATEEPIVATARSGNAYVVTGGLRAGDTIVVGGEQKLRPGDKLKPVQISPAQAGEQPIAGEEGHP